MVCVPVRVMLGVAVRVVVWVPVHDADADESSHVRVPLVAMSTERLL